MDLLYKMVNSQNVVIVVEKMIEVLRTTSVTDEFLRKLLVERIIEISEKYPWRHRAGLHHQRKWVSHENTGV